MYEFGYYPSFDDLYVNRAGYSYVDKRQRYMSIVNWAAARYQPRRSLTPDHEPTRRYRAVVVAAMHRYS